MLNFKKNRGGGNAKWTIARHLTEPKTSGTDSYIYQHLPYASTVTDSIISTRDGELIGTVLVHGMSAETADIQDLEIQTTNFARIVDQVQGMVSFQVNKITTFRDSGYDAIEGDSFASLVDQRWHNSFGSKRPMQRYNLITVGIRPSKSDSLTKVFSGGGATTEKMREGLIAILDNILDELVRAFATAKSERLTISSGKFLGFLSAINTADYHPIYPMGYGLPIAAQLPENDILFKRNTFTVEGCTKKESTTGAVLSIKKYPNSTHTGFYDGLDIPVKMVTTHSFIPVPPNIALERVKIIAKQMKSAQDAARSLEAELYEAQDDLASGRITLGNHHSTIAIHAQDEEELEEVLSYIKRAGGIGGGTLHREGLAMRSAFFAQHPGNQNYRSRTAMISGKNFADMVSFHNRPTGKTSNVPWGKPLTQFRTAENDIFSFNFHQEQNSGKNELTAGHTLILGHTGTGKSVMAAFLMAQAKRFDTRIFCFDKDQGLEIPLRALGVAYSKVRVGESTGLNPFASEVDNRGVGWLATWVEGLVNYNEPISSAQRNVIANAVAENAAAAADGMGLNTFENFVSFFNSVDDGGDLAERFKEWTEGRYKWLFDGTGDDPLSDNNRSVAFDFTELFDDPIMRSAWLSYVFRRIERIVEDGKPTMIVMDEAWKLLDDDRFAKTIKDWLLVMRKKNVVVMMLTQLPEHISGSAAGDAIAGGISTKIVFRTPKAVPENYMKIGFSAAEAQAIKTVAASRSVLCVSDRDSLVLDLDLSALGGALDVLGGGGAARRALPDNWENDPEFWRHLI